MKRRLKILIAAALIGVFAFGLLRYPTASAQAALYSLRLCASSVVPALFPFMVLSGLCVGLGLTELVGRRLTRLARAFSLSGTGLGAYLLGLIGGYPLGAATVSRLYEEGRLSRPEAARLLGFCDNCGPAFAIMVAGTGIFGEAKYGFFLFAVHCLSSLLPALMTKAPVSALPASPPSAPLSPVDALNDAVRRAASACLALCGYVVLFGIVTGLLDASGLLPALCGRLSLALGLELHFVRSALTGFFELASGIGSMAGLAPNAASLALASFILGWGGLSVQAQAASLITGAGLSAKSHLLGKARQALIAAALSLAASPLL